MAEELREIYPIIETFVAGLTGYRVYSDGYCEQWGLTTIIADYGTCTVNFLKEFKDLNYCIVKGTCMPSTGDDSSYNDATCIRWATRTTKNFQLYNRGATDGGRYVYWRAYGYLKEGTYGNN